MLKGKTIIVGVCGGIPAYKSCEIVRGLKKQGADVWAIMTGSAQKFISPLTLRTLSENPVITELFDPDLKNLPIPHIALREKADLVLVSPATANMIGKTANGIADDALSTLLLSVKCPVIFAPAMNPAMWENQAVQANLKKLKERGINFVGPDNGKVVCGDVGTGRLASVPAILEAVSERFFTGENDLEGLNILVTAGPTREAIDPIRFISNRSSGKMGYAVAQAAKRRGAKVTLISGPSHLRPPAGIEFIPVITAEELHEAIKSVRKKANVIIMTAAVADYRPRFAFMQKLQKRGEYLNLEFTRTVDVLEELGKSKNGCYLVGFAAESTNLVENARAKMEKKNLDLIIVNDLSAFEGDKSEAIILTRKGDIHRLPHQEKTQLADLILDKVRIMTAGS